MTVVPAAKPPSNERELRRVASRGDRPTTIGVHPLLAAPRPSQRVLIVADDPQLRRLIRIMLEQHGCAAQEAAGREDAERTLERDAVDVLLLARCIPDASNLD